MKKRVKPDAALYAAGMLLFLLAPPQAAEGVRAGLRLCAGVLIPSLFPVCVLVLCLLKSGASFGGSAPVRALERLFGLPEAGLEAILFGLAGGFPLGAQVLSEQYLAGRLTQAEAKRCTALCNNAGPAFLIGAVGAQVLADARYGLLLCLVQLLSVLCIGAAMQAVRPLPRRDPPCPAQTRAPASAVFAQALGAGALAMLRVAGAVAFFGAVQGCLQSLCPNLALPPVLRAVLSGFLELSGGVALLRGLPPAQALPAAAAMIAWGGCCVHLQAASFLSEAGLPLGPGIIGKLVQTGLCLALALAAVQTLPFPALLLPALALIGIFFLFLSAFRKKPLENGKNCAIMLKKTSQEARHAVS